MSKKYTIKKEHGDELEIIRNLSEEDVKEKIIKWSKKGWRCILLPIKENKK